MRIIVGLLFASHGGQKILGFPPGGHGAPEGALMILGAWVELAGGLMVAVGFLTRIAAFLCAGEMAVAYFMMHAQGGFFPIVNHGEAAVFYCFAFLFIMFEGSGWLSLDAMLFKGSSTAPGTAAAT